MGYRERVIVEAVCDVCKKDIGDRSIRVGTLETRAPGARGRSERWEVAFHAVCYKKLVSTAIKPKPAASSRAKRTRTRSER